MGFVRLVLVGEDGGCRFCVDDEAFDPPRNGDDLDRRFDLFGEECGDLMVDSSSDSSLAAMSNISKSYKLDKCSHNC